MMVDEPEALPDRDYTTQQTADLCQISINTLLSWERRYGVPSPRRNERGERVYGLNDLNQIRFLQAETARGTTIREAARIVLGGSSSPRDGVQPEDVVVAVNHNDTTAQVTPPRQTPSRHEHLQRDLATAIERYDRAGISTLLTQLALESDPAAVANAIILPVVSAIAATVGPGRGDLTPLQVATPWLSARLSSWLDAINPSRKDANATVVLVPDTSPVGGIALLSHALLLARQGAHVIDLPPDTPLEGIVAVVRAVRPDRIELPHPQHAAHGKEPERAALLRALLPGIAIVAGRSEGRRPQPNEALLDAARAEMATDQP
ncbi:MAG: MerR family transcriptional regulator [Thermomicrobiales bacterium]